jgi:hypothetical protein
MKTIIEKPFSNISGDNHLTVHLRTVEIGSRDFGIHPFVVHHFNNQTGDFFWGCYCATLAEAVAYYNRKGIHTFITESDVMQTAKLFNIPLTTQEA